jgi:hypothetical protein
MMRAHGHVAKASLLLSLALAVGASGCSRKSASADEPRRESTASALATSSTAASDAGKPPQETRAKKPFGTHCTRDDECAGEVCFHQRIKGPDAGREERGKSEQVEPDGYCSIRCNADEDCPVPLTRGKCGARGMCKKP